MQSNRLQTLPLRRRGPPVKRQRFQDEVKQEEEVPVVDNPFAAVAMEWATQRVPKEAAPSVVRPTLPRRPPVAMATLPPVVHLDACRCLPLHPLLVADRRVRTELWCKHTLPRATAFDHLSVFFFCPVSTTCAGDDLYLAGHPKVRACNQVLVLMADDALYSHWQHRNKTFKEAKDTDTFAPESCLATLRRSRPTSSFVGPSTRITLARPSRRPWHASTCTQILDTSEFRHGFEVVVTWDRLFCKRGTQVPSLHDQFTGSCALLWQWVQMVSTLIPTEGFWLGSLACTCYPCTDPRVGECKHVSFLRTQGALVGLSLLHSTTTASLLDEESNKVVCGQHAFEGSSLTQCEVHVYFVFYRSPPLV
jgi:hypothetical protein